MKKDIFEEVVIEKIIPGGQALGTLKDGKKILVWGGLPDEKLIVRITKSKRSWSEGLVSEVITKSKHRIEPKDSESYLSTSPWQTMRYQYENQLKQDLVVEQFAQQNINLSIENYTAPDEPYHYRNKMEFSFWWSKETEQLELAFFKRSTHSKQPVKGSSLAMPCINRAAKIIVEYLRANGAEARQLKTLLIRCSQSDVVAAELYVKDESFGLRPTHQELELNGFKIHYSTHKSPASVITKTLFNSGNSLLTDTLNGRQYSYSVNGFFQVNIPIYEKTLDSIKKHIPVDAPILDMYSGVGSIGLSVCNQQKLTLVESDQRCIEEAKLNASYLEIPADIIHSSSETALEHISGQETTILDPPRAGLHQDVINRLNEVRPQTIVYLSCNPATQARDVAPLRKNYKITYCHTFNFFPRTPHIENLIILKKT